MAEGVVARRTGFNAVLDLLPTLPRGELLNVAFRVAGLTGPLIEAPQELLLQGPAARPSRARHRRVQDALRVHALLPLALVREAAAGLGPLLPRLHCRAGRRERRGPLRRECPTNTLRRTGAGRRHLT